MSLDPDETIVCEYLSNWPGQYVSIAEICRRAAGRLRYRADPYWAHPIASRLVEAKILETDSEHRYRIVSVEVEKVLPGRRKKRYVAPQIREILEQSGKVFDLGDIDPPEGQDAPRS
jgi:hypothetical protein